MTGALTAFRRVSIGTIVGGAALLWSGQLPLDAGSPLVSSAEARIGRPATPMSYAGVARRTTRAVGVGAAGVAVGAAAGAAAVRAAPVVVAPAAPVVAAPVAVAPVAAAPLCSQVVDAYGRLFTVCR